MLPRILLIINDKPETSKPFAIAKPPPISRITPQETPFSTDFQLIIDGDRRFQGSFGNMKKRKQQNIAGTWSSMNLFQKKDVKFWNKKK